MTSQRLNAEARDEIYTELCTLISDCADRDDAPISRSELFLSRLCLLLIEQLGDADLARDALRRARSEPENAI